MRDVKTFQLAVLPSFSGVFFRKKDVEWQKNDDCPSFSVKKSAKKEGEPPHPVCFPSLQFFRGMGNPQDSLVSHPSLKSEGCGSVCFAGFHILSEI